MQNIFVGMFTDIQKVIYMIFSKLPYQVYLLTIIIIQVSHIISSEKMQIQKLLVKGIFMIKNGLI